MKTITEIADAIEAANTPQSAAYKVAAAERIRGGQVDLNDLEQIERSARRQLQACNAVRRIMGLAQVKGEG